MGFFEKIKKGLSKTRDNMSIKMNNMFAAFSGENDDFYDELEETLILADTGVETASDSIEKLRELVKKRGLRGGEEVKSAFSEVMAELLDVGDRQLHMDSKPCVILMVGVNGVGKTTTIGKLAAKLTAEGKKVLLVAGDTFRAAAAEQLTIWGREPTAALSAMKRAPTPPLSCLTVLQPPRQSAGCYNYRHRGQTSQQAEPYERTQQNNTHHRPRAAGRRQGNPHGARRDHRTERSYTGQAVQGNGRYYRHCPKPSLTGRQRAALFSP
jgi:hypothetical protein